MKLILAEHPEKGIWYFSTQRKCAAYIGVADPQVKTVLDGKRNHTHNWKLQWIESDDVISKYIDPEL